MLIRFQLSLDDVRRLQQESRLSASRRFSDQAASRIWWFLLAPVMIVAVGVASGSFPVGVGAYGLYWGAGHLFNRWVKARHARSYYTEANFARSLLPFELELLPDRLAIRNAVSTHEYLWPGFSFLQETPRYLYLCFSPVSSIGVPKSAFGSAAELEAFRQTVKAHQPAGT